MLQKNTNLFMRNRRKKIQEEAKEKQADAGREFGNGKSSSSPNGEKLNSKVHTDKELAKLSKETNISTDTYKIIQM